MPALQKAGASSQTVDPLTAGLVLLSVTHLRRYAEGTLPVNSRLREGFLEDVADLEDPGLGRGEGGGGGRMSRSCGGGADGRREIFAEYFRCFRLLVPEAFT